MVERGKPEREGEAGWGDLMAAAQAGDRVAYDKLLRAILPSLRGFVRSRVSQPEMAEDVVQNVLFSIHRARHTFQPGRAFGPWMRTIARNAALDAQRARSTRLKVEVAIGEAEVADDREPFVGAMPLSARMAGALAELPAGQREAVEMIHLEQLSVREAAARVGITPGALKVRAHRGYKALRVLLGPDE